MEGVTETRLRVRILRVDGTEYLVLYGLDQNGKTIVDKSYELYGHVGSGTNKIVRELSHEATLDQVIVERARSTMEGVGTLSVKDKSLNIFVKIHNFLSHKQTVLLDGKDIEEVIHL